MRAFEIFENNNTHRIMQGINWQNVEDFEWVEEDAAEELDIDIWDLDDSEFEQFRRSKWYQNKIYRAAENTYKKLLDMFDDGKILVRREITADRWNPSRPIGEYWSWGDAEAYCGETGLKRFYLFETHVEDNIIDWAATIWKNCPWALHEEQEIHLIEGSPITLEKIYTKKDCNDEYKLIDPSKYKNYKGIV